MTLTIKQCELYGNIVFYPVCEAAKAAAEMLKQKTLTNRDLAYLERMGFMINKAVQA